MAPHEIYSGRSGKTRTFYDFQRRIPSRDSRDGRNGVIRTGTDLQNRPVPFLLEAPATRTKILCLWRLSPTRWNAIKRIKARFQALIVPYYLARVNRSRRKKHGETQWPKDHWNAMDAKKGSKEAREGHHRNQVATRREVLKFSAGPSMDRRILSMSGQPHDNRHLLRRAMAPNVSVREHHHTVLQRYKSASWTDESKKRFRNSYEGYRKSSKRTRTPNSFIPKNETTRQRPFDEELQAKLEWLNQNLRPYFSQTSSSSSSSQNWWQHEHHQDSQWREYQDTRWQGHQWQDHRWRDHKWWKQGESWRLFAKPMWQAHCQNLAHS